jgi:hypothetical protein
MKQVLLEKLRHSPSQQPPFEGSEQPDTGSYPEAFALPRISNSGLRVTFRHIELPLPPYPSPSPKAGDHPFVVCGCLLKIFAQDLRGYYFFF